MAGEIHLDALPYIDQGYEAPGVREAVRRDTTLSCCLFSAHYIYIYVQS